MSEESVVFLAEISSSQAVNKSAVEAAVSPSPFDVPEKKVAGEGERGEESPVGGLEGPNEVGGVCETEAGTEADVQMWRRRRMKTLMLLVAWTRLGSLDTSLRDSRSQRSCVEKDWRRRLCLRVSLTPLTFQNVSF